MNTPVTMPKSRPILMSGPMVQALLANRKTQTRRVVKFKPSPLHDTPHDWAKSVHKSAGGNWIFWSGAQTNLPELTLKAYPGDEGFKCPFGAIGDRLWVREKHRTWVPMINTGEPVDGRWHVRYAADNLERVADCEWDEGNDYVSPEESGVTQELRAWKPSIFLPRWASRITLEITDVRCERLQAISCEDLTAEGAEGLSRKGLLVRRNDCNDSMQGYKELWNKLNAKRGYSWESNPWVWCISFRRLNESDA